MSVIKDFIVVDDINNIIFNVLTDIDSSVSIFGAILMFIRGKNNRARRMLGYTLLLWGLCSVARGLVLQAGMLPLLLHPLRPVGLIGGNIFIVFLMFFPLEVMLPGWLNARRLLMLFMPVTILTLLYLGINGILGEEIIEIDSLSEFAANIGSFNVWFRILFLVPVIMYNIFLLRLIYRNEKKYVRWRNDNFSDIDSMDISWMRLYSFFTILIFAGWVMNVFVAGTWNFVIHTLLAIVSFGFFVYKGLFYESAYPEDFFKYMHGNILGPCEEEFGGQEGSDEETQAEKAENASFEEKIPGYVQTFNDWMEKEKPYLFRDFKLTDVCRVLPLNRSYLSRVFNEGFGMNFCQVVRKYRVEDSKKLLKECPELPIYEVAEQCGFSSDTIFIRAFQKEMGMTPSRYRLEK